MSIPRLLLSLTHEEKKQKARVIKPGDVFTIERWVRNGTQLAEDVLC